MKWIHPQSILIHCMQDLWLHLLLKLPQDNPLLAVTLNNNYSTAHTSVCLHAYLANAVQFRLHSWDTKIQTVQFDLTLHHIACGSTHVVGGWTAKLLAHKYTLVADMLYTVHIYHKRQFLHKFYCWKVCEAIPSRIYFCMDSLTLSYDMPYGTRHKNVMIILVSCFSIGVRTGGQVYLWPPQLTYTS